MKTKMLLRKTAGLSLLAFLITSCNSNTIYSKYESIDVDKGWSKNEKIKFEVNLEDNQPAYNVFVHVRNSEGYPYRNLFLFLHTTYPSGKKVTDTLECLLANEKGEWLGSGAGDLWDNTILFKRNVSFPEKGKYIFEYEQAMRYGDQNSIDPLPLILDMGLSIEKVQ